MEQTQLITTLTIEIICEGISFILMGLLLILGAGLLMKFIRPKDQENATNMTVMCTVIIFVAIVIILFHIPNIMSPTAVLLDERPELFNLEK